MTKEQYDQIKLLIDANNGDAETQEIIYNILQTLGERESYDNIDSNNDIVTFTFHRYYVDFAVRGYKGVTVWATDKEQASKTALKEVQKVNFGELEEIAYEEIGCEVEK